jgi:hypothetical protein
MDSTMQIAFLTLFLGLTLGAYPVELAVEGPVAAVELLLDGAGTGRIAGPPWKGQVDFGTSLAPHELVARALDGQGQEVGRTRQWVNLPRPAAEVGIVLEGAHEGKPVHVRLSWQSRTGERPISARLTLDDKPLDLDEVGRAILPSYDPESPHVLSAELSFPEGVTARRDVVFGGRYGFEVSTELTAIPVRLRHGRLPGLEALQGWLLASGRPLTVAAVDEGPGEVLIVRDLGAHDALDKLGDVRPLRIQNGTKSLSYDPDYLRYEIALRKEDEVGFIWPVTRSFTGGGLPAELFPRSRSYTAEDGGMHWLLTRVLPGKELGAGQRLADAVAVAGLQAMAGNRPRAVVLILGPSPEDASRYDPATVRQYLRAIRVPLFVWQVGQDAKGITAWEKVEDVSTVPKLRGAVGRLKGELAAQRILWVEGTWLPQSVSLGRAAAGTVELP